MPLYMLCILMGMLSACRNNAPLSIEEIEKDSDINVCFKISTGAQSNTRSILPEEYGTQIENRIGMEDFVILIFDDDNKKLRDILYSDGETADETSLLSLGMGEYLLQTKLSPDKYSLASRFSIVALANWDSLKEGSKDLDLTEGETDLETVMQQTYLINNRTNGADGLEESWIPTDNSLIPMFGLLHASLSGYSTSLYNEANPMDVGVVDMLRALVKLEVIDNTSGKDAEILSITLNKRNTRGYLTPYLGVGDNTTQVESARVPETVGVANPAGYTENEIIFKKEGNKYYAYVPEFMLADAISNRPQINVTITYSGFVETRKIVLAPYDTEGNPYRPTSGYTPEWRGLLRNHIYRFTIKSITADPNLQLIVDVQPYSCVNLLPQLGLERTEDGYIIVKDRNGNIVKYIRPNGSILTFEEDNRWPYLGTFMGVFDSTKRVLIGYFPDGRTIIFNYTSNEFNENNILENLESWEIYSKATLKDSNGNPVEEHLEETFSFKAYANEGVSGGDIKLAYTHTLLDQKGRVIEEYCYKTLNDFEQYKLNNSNFERTKLAEYTGDRYGDKVVTYYDKDGKVICTLTVKGDNETYK